MGFDSTEPARPFVIRSEVAAPLAECQSWPRKTEQPDEGGDCS